MTLPAISHRISFILLVLISSIYYLVSSPSLVHAAELKLVVSPPLTELSPNPGEVSQKIIKLTNNGNTEVELKATISDFIVEDNQGTPVKVSGQASGRYFAAPWFTLNRTTFTIPPQGTEEIIVVIDTPKNALPGGHYAGVFFSPANKTSPNGTGAEVIPEIGSLFAISIPGDVNYDAIISSFTTAQPLFEFGPITFQAKIENQSDTHINPSATITIKDLLGRTLETLTLPTTNIFPFTSRTLTGTWDTVWGLGRYSAELTVPYGPNFVASRILYFWILPYRLLAALLIVILVLVAFFIIIRRHRKHMTDTRDSQIDSLKRRIVELENKR